MSASEATYDRHDPRHEVRAENPWYTASQFDVHFSNPSYRAGVERRWQLFIDLIRDWLSLRDGSEGIRILDAGCGDGINLLGIEKHRRSLGVDVSLHGLDYNSLRLGRASSVPGNGALLQGSATRLPYRDGCFDVVLCSQVLEHVPGAEDAIDEFRRVVKPGGLIVLAVPNEGCLLARLRNRVLQPSIHRRTDHVNFYTEATFTDCVRKSGLEVRRIEPEGFFYPHLRLHVYVGARNWGRRLSGYLARWFPSQAGGLIYACSPVIE